MANGQGAPGQAFISYSRRDVAFVRELHGFLTGAGRAVWVDWEDIPPGSKWEQDIDDSIDSSESFVFVLSPSSLASEYCGAELRHAEERGKRIVPIAIDGARSADAPPALRELNWIWCRETDDREAAYAALTQALDTDLAWARAHTRLMVRAVEWDTRGDGSLLLRGKDLDEAERVLAANAGKEPRATELQRRYVHESRRAASRRLRTLLAGVMVALAVAIVLGILALLQRNSARSATHAATSSALGSAANDLVEPKLDQALLLALAAYRSSPSAGARSAVISALEAARKLGVSELLHSDAPVLGVAFAPNGETAAVAGGDGTLRLWDVAARKAAGELSLADGRPIAAAAFSTDGSKVAAGGHREVRVWDVESRRPVGRNLRAPGTILSTAVSSDGRAAAAMDARGHVWLWNTRSGSLRRLDGPRGGKTMLAFSPGGRTLAAGATDIKDVEEGSPGAVRLWSVGSGKALGELPSDDTVNGLVFTPDGRGLVTVGYYNAGRYSPGDSYGEVQLWDVGQLHTVQLLKTKDPVERVAFTPDRRTVAVGLYGGLIRLALPEKGKWVGPLRGVRTRATTVAFSRDGHTVATAGAGDTTVRVWDRHRAPFARPIGPSDDGLTTVAFSPDGRTVAAAGGNEKTVRLVDVRGGTYRVPRWLAKAGWAEEVALSPDGHTIAVRRQNGSVRLVDLKSHEVVGLPADGSEYSGALAFDPAGAVLAVGNEEGTLRFWDVKDRTPKPLGKPLHTHGVQAAGFVDGGRTLVTVSGDGYVERWNVARGKADGPPRRPVSGVSAAAISADGHTFAFSFGHVSLWDSRRAAAAAPLSGEGAGGPALSADGRTLAVTGSKGIQLWDVRSRRRLGTPFGKGGGLAFSPDGTVLAGADGPIRLYKGILWRDPADLRAHVCGLVLGDLTKAEWAVIAPGLAYRRTCS